MVLTQASFQHQGGKKSLVLIVKDITPISNLPKEVIFAVELPFSRKAFLSQIAFALTALHTLDVPRSVQHIEQEPVQYRPLAACTVDHRLWMLSHNHCCVSLHNLTAFSYDLTGTQKHTRAEGYSKSFVSLCERLLYETRSGGSTTFAFRPKKKTTQRKKDKPRATKCEPSHAGGRGPDRASAVSRIGPLPHKHICSDAKESQCTWVKLNHQPDVATRGIPSRISKLRLLSRLKHWRKTDEGEVSVGRAECNRNKQMR